jgi:pyruvate/2-oxoglutarate dehydrogenase complex dihydrolipoamide acyltransferase (E2) component
LVEVETEKSIVELEAVASGRLAEILVGEGETAKVGTKIARIETDELVAEESVEELPMAPAKKVDPALDARQPSSQAPVRVRR